MGICPRHVSKLCVADLSKRKKKQRIAFDENSRLVGIFILHKYLTQLSYTKGQIFAKSAKCATKLVMLWSEFLNLAPVGHGMTKTLRASALVLTWQVYLA